MIQINNISNYILNYLNDQNIYEVYIDRKIYNSNNIEMFNIKLDFTDIQLDTMYSMNIDYDSMIARQILNEFENFLFKNTINEDSLIFKIEDLDEYINSGYRNVYFLCDIYGVDDKLILESDISKYIHRNNLNIYRNNNVYMSHYNMFNMFKDKINIFIDDAFIKTCEITLKKTLDFRIGVDFSNMKNFVLIDSFNSKSYIKEIRSLKIKKIV